MSLSNCPSSPAASIHCASPVAVQLSQIRCVLLASGEESRKAKFMQARQFPVSDSQLVRMDQVSNKEESSVSGMQMAGNMPNNILHDFPVSNA
nr:uncharacterized protein LOC109184378 [Ipomoea trifida]